VLNNARTKIQELKDQNKQLAVELENQRNMTSHLKHKTHLLEKEKDAKISDLKNTIIASIKTGDLMKQE
jgi:predicted RNase H-like nuclease (RuvC/YqgF family)